MAKLLGIGSALFDMLMTVEGFPKEDSKVQGIESKAQGGGPCAGALVAAGKLGIEAGYIGTLGDDAYGDFIRESLSRYGVGTDHVRIVKGAVSYHSIVILNLQNATRTCVWSRGNVPSPKMEDVDIRVLREASFLHLDGHHLETAIYAARKAREYGIKVSLDAGGVYPGIRRLLPHVDILIPSEEFSLKFTGDRDVLRAAEILEGAYHPEVLIVTQGARGGFLWQEGREVRYPAFRVKAVDSNGAGDTFHGAFLAARMKGMELLEAAGFASAASALKCTRFGTQEGIPGFDEVLKFIQEYQELEE